MRMRLEGLGHTPVYKHLLVQYQASQIQCTIKGTCQEKSTTKTLSNYSCT